MLLSSIAVLACFLVAEDALPSFEVASLKVAAAEEILTGEDRRGQAIPLAGSGPEEGHGRLEYRSVALKSLLQRAFGLSADQIGGPAWLQTARYELRAKYQAGTKDEDVSLMLRRLVVERFGLQFHYEKRPQRVYALAREKGRNKIRSAAGELTSLKVSMGDQTRRIAGQLDAKTLVSILKGSVDRPVEDSTGIAGLFNVNLEWAHSVGATNAAGDPLPSLSTVLHEQLGLRLVPEKKVTHMLVVDRATKIPLGN